MKILHTSDWYLGHTLVAIYFTQRGQKNVESLTINGER